MCLRVAATFTEVFFSPPKQEISQTIKLWNKLHCFCCPRHFPWPWLEGQIVLWVFKGAIGWVSCSPSIVVWLLHGFPQLPEKCQTHSCPCAWLPQLPLSHLTGLPRNLLWEQWAWAAKFIIFCLKVAMSLTELKSYKRKLIFGWTSQLSLISLLLHTPSLGVLHCFRGPWKACTWIYGMK